MTVPTAVPTAVSTAAIPTLPVPTTSLSTSSSTAPAAAWVAAVHVDVEGDGRASELAHLVERATEGGPFRLAGVDIARAGASRCRFVPVRPGMALGYRNVIELQARLDRVVHLVGVSCSFERNADVDAHLDACA